MNALLANIDARKGEASFPADVELITRMVKASVGFDAMNAVVVKEMRGQMAASAPPTYYIMQCITRKVAAYHEYYPPRATLITKPQHRF